MAREETRNNNIAQGLVDDITKAAGALFDATKADKEGMRLGPVANSMFGGGITANVLLDYPWMEDGILTKNEKKNIPYIYMKEYEITENGIYSTLNYYTWQAEEIAKDNGNPYRGLYAGKPTGMQYYFPYLSQFFSSLTKQWDLADNMAKRTGMDTSALGIFGSAVEAGAELVGSAAKMAGVLNNMKARLQNKNNVATLNPVMPYVWSGSNGAPLNIQFYLFNTNSPPSVWVKNWKLLTYLKMACSFNQINSLYATPPAIYVATVPSIIHFPAAYISKLTINQCGNCILFSLGDVMNVSTSVITNFREGGGYQQLGGSSGGSQELSPNNQNINATPTGEMTGKMGSTEGPMNDIIIVPDAWELQLELTPIVPQSRQVIFNGVIKGGSFDNVRAISTSEGSGDGSSGSRAEVPDPYSFNPNTASLPSDVADNPSQEVLETQMGDSKSEFDGSSIQTLQ